MNDDSTKIAWHEAEHHALFSAFFYSVLKYSVTKLDGCFSYGKGKNSRFSNE